MIGTLQTGEASKQELDHCTDKLTAQRDLHVER